MTELTPQLMDEITDTVILALRDKYPAGINIGAASVTLASLSVALMAHHHNIDTLEAKSMIKDFITQAPLETMRAVPIEEALKEKE